ncbi:MAG: 50S ribosomal protein L18 [Patescibacteria group bacterium]
MDNNKVKKQKQIRRHAKVRSQINGTIERPRFSVFRSNKGLFLQLIDDLNGKTLVSVSNSDIKEKQKGTKTDLSFELGKLIAEKAKAKKITAVVFDRGSYKYHGRVKAVADGAREGGLLF